MPSVISAITLRLCGIEFILTSRTNQAHPNESGWGLTTHEYDRAYSTFIASYTLSRLLRTNSDSLSPDVVSTCQLALSESRSWLLSTRNGDGGWGSVNGAPSNVAATSMVLLALFIQGEDPRQHCNSYEYLMSRVRDGLWDMECELVVTQEGYELNQEWLSSVFCFRALIFFAEMGIAPLSTLHGSYKALLTLIEDDGAVRLIRGNQTSLAWPIPYMLEAIDKFNVFIRSNKRDCQAFLDQSVAETVRHKIESVKELMRNQFPYPISHQFAAFERELDYHRKVELMLQVEEVMLKYAAIVGLSAYLSVREQHQDINELLGNRFGAVR